MLAVQNLSVAYPDGTKAVSSVSFGIRGGESAALIGPNGAGKTSLLLSLVGLLPFDGRITAAGAVLDKNTLGRVRRDVGIVFQNPDDQLFMPTIFEDVAFGPRNHGLPEEEVKERADAVLGELGIEGLRNRSPLKLSGGEKRIASIAAVLAMRPSVILLDEPTAFLDPRGRRSLITLLKKLPQAKLIATHDLPFAAEVCERALLLKDGALYADGRPRDLFQDSEVMEGCGVEAL